MEGRIKLLIDGEEAEAVSVYVYLITNTGNTPIRPNDFVEPIQVSVEEPWRLLAVDTSWSSPSTLKVSWNKTLTNTFEMEPALLNPNDSFQSVFFITSTKKEDIVKDNTPELNWRARIVNVRSLETKEPESPGERSNLGIFYVVINHSGWGVYILAGLSLTLFFAALWLGVKNKRFSSFSTYHIILFSAMMLLSFSTSEILVDAFVNHHYTQWWGMKVLVVLHLLLLIYLAWPFLWGRVSSVLPSATEN